MASTYTETEKVAAEPHVEKAAPPPPPPEIRASAEKDRFAVPDVVLRFLLLASCVAAVVVMVTSKQKKLIAIPFPPFQLPQSAEFKDSPAFIYFVAALSAAGLYSLITTLVSFYSLLKPGCCPKVISHFIIFDVLFLGIVASATGSAGAVGYIGLKGNSHVRWNKVCNVFDDFCKHVGASIAVSLVASVVLVLLVVLSVYSLSKKIPKHNHSH
ncbi:hypothetical protein ACS0TY_014517 [Phlomoides rotata]